MNDGSKALIGAIAGFTALVAIFAILADCAKQVSRTGSDAVEACVRSGGHWVGSNDGFNTGLDYCSMPEKAGKAP